jgi:hypothetical protein
VDAYISNECGVMRLMSRHMANRTLEREEYQTVSDHNPANTFGMNSRNHLNDVVLLAAATSEIISSHLHPIIPVLCRHFHTSLVKILEFYQYRLSQTLTESFFLLLVIPDQTEASKSGAGRRT